MAKGMYAVSEVNDAPPKRDASFKSCLCALLVFAAICAIMLLASLRWIKDTSKEEAVKEEEKYVLGSHGNVTETTQKSTVTTTAPIFHSEDPTLSTRQTPIKDTERPIKSTNYLETTQRSASLTSKTSTAASTVPIVNFENTTVFTKQTSINDTERSTESTNYSELETTERIVGSTSKTSTSTTPNNTIPFTRQTSTKNVEYSTESTNSESSTSTEKSMTFMQTTIGVKLNSTDISVNQSTSTSTVPETPVLLSTSISGETTSTAPTESTSMSTITPQTKGNFFTTKGTSIRTTTMIGSSNNTTDSNIDNETKTDTTNEFISITTKNTTNYNLGLGNNTNATTMVYRKSTPQVLTSTTPSNTENTDTISSSTQANNKTPQIVNETETIYSETSLWVTTPFKQDETSTTFFGSDIASNHTSRTGSIKLSTLSTANNTKSTLFNSTTSNFSDVDISTAYSTLTTMEITNRNAIETYTNIYRSTGRSSYPDIFTHSTGTGNTEATVTENTDGTTPTNGYVIHKVSLSTTAHPNLRPLEVVEVINDYSEEYSTEIYDEDLKPAEETEHDGGHLNTITTKKNKITDTTSSTKIYNRQSSEYTKIWNTTIVKSSPTEEYKTSSQKGSTNNFSNSSVFTVSSTKMYDKHLNSSETNEFGDNLDTTTTVITPTTDKTLFFKENANLSRDATLLYRNPTPVCHSVECKSAASRMLSLMDHSRDPCNDFYEFACGGMPVESADTDIGMRLSEQLLLINDTSPPYLRTFKTFYKSCVSHEYKFDYQERVDSVIKLVKEVGEIAEENAPVDTMDITQLFTNLIVRQSHPFMDIDIDIDDQNSEFVLKLTPPRPVSVLRENGRWSAFTEAQIRCLQKERHKLQQPNLVDLTKIYESYLMCQKNHAIYLNSIETVVQALGFYSHLNNTFNESLKIQHLKSTIEWDVLNQLDTPLPSEVKQETLIKNYTSLSLSDLQIQYPLLDWKELLSNLTGRNLESHTRVQVYFPNYFKNVFQKLHTLEKWKLNNALITIYAQNLYENLVIPQAKHTREDYCLSLSTELFHDVSSKLYAMAWPKAAVEENQQFLIEIFNYLKLSLKAALLKERWLDAYSKSSVMLKLKKMQLTFNKHGDNFNNETLLNEKYGSATFTKAFPDNVMKMLQIDRRTRYALIGEKCTTEYLWSYFLSVYDTKPTSFYTKKSIIVPLGMLRKPVKGLPGYITMARIGLSLAKEIGRHFDPVGIRNGMSLSPESQPPYESLKAVMENKSPFNVTKVLAGYLVTFTVDPRLSTNDRIAENTGFRLISDNYEIFREQSILPWVPFSKDQIFYITVGQEYCHKTDMIELMQQLFESDILPPPFQVENIATNSRQFSQAFNCPLDSRMNRNRRKMQFPHLLETDVELL